MVKSLLIAHHLSNSEVCDFLETSEDGLTTAEVEKRQAAHGLNRLPESKKLRVVRLFLSQFANAMVVLMSIAALLSFLFGHLLDTILIAGMVLINGIMGFLQEYRAEQSVAALKQLLVSRVLVRRNSQTIEITQEQVTIGDVILLQAGDKVPADAYVMTARNCYINEATLTGESEPVEKKMGLVDEQAVLSERFNRLWMGTTLTQGTVEAVITSIGAETQFGRIAVSLETVEIGQEHFSQKITMLSRQMGTIAIVSAIITFFVGFFLRNFSFAEISIYTIATLVSALPEGLPIILVIVLTVGAQRMARKNAIVRKLSATETLGVVSIIVTDKTGTLTQNIMSARTIYLPGQPLIDVSSLNSSEEAAFNQQTEPLLLHDNFHLNKLIAIAGVCHQIRVSDQEKIAFSTIYGDPTEKALFLLAHKAGFHALEPIHQPTVLDNLPFQQQLRLRASLVQTSQYKEIFILGAPEGVLDRCSQAQFGTTQREIDASEKAMFEAQITTLSKSGLRVVALASFPVKTAVSLSSDTVPTENGVFVGLVGLYDPPRPEVSDALQEAKQAGIRIVMATGDHPQTALAIAKEIGLVTADYDAGLVATQSDLENKSDQELTLVLSQAQILARLTPEMKMKVAGVFQAGGAVVAMTGDGVNDAPALKKADVGISMGISGTEVAREASKIVLADDNFASIVAAVKEGRTQFNNLRRTSFFLIMTNVSESVTLLMALLLGYPLPLLPLQILWLNVITGGITDFALSLEPSRDESMKHPPRSPAENILNFKVLPLIGIVTLVTTVLGLSVFHYFLPVGVGKAQAALFVILSCSQLLNMLSLRSLKKSVITLGFFSNKPVVAAFVVSFGLLLSALWFPPLQSSLKFGSLSMSEFTSLLLISSLIFVTAELVKLALARIRRS